MPGAGPAFANVVITPIFVINMFDLPRRNALQHSFRAVGGAVAGGACGRWKCGQWLSFLSLTTIPDRSGADPAIAKYSFQLAIEIVIALAVYVTLDLISFI